MQQQQTHNEEVKEQISTLKEQIHSNHTACTENHRALHEHCTQLEKENKMLKTQIQHGQQRDSEYDLVVTGIPEEDGENLHEILASIATLLQVDLLEQDIGQINRIRSTNPTSNQPRFTYVSLESRAKRNLLLTKAKEIAELTATQIHPHFPATRIHINEWQSTSLNSLYRKAKEAARRLNYKFTWFSYGKIRVRRDENSNTIIINDEEDIAKIIP